MDTTNETAKDPRSKGWVTSIALIPKDGILPTQHVLVGYDHLPFGCKACHNWSNRVRDCSEIPKHPIK